MWKARADQGLLLKLHLARGR